MARSIGRTGSLLGVASLLVALAAAPVASSGALRADAPFVALASGHVGAPYSDQLADAFDLPVTNYRVVSGSLPHGLLLDPASGVVSGTPGEARVVELRVAGTPVAGGSDISVRASLAVFSAHESEIVPGQSFETWGQFHASVRNATFTWTSSFDHQSYPASVILYTPDGLTGALPLIIFHRGRGFNFDEYNNFLERIASWGIVCATISDEQSFEAPSNPGVVLPLDDDSGMESASAAQEALMDYVLGLSATAGDPLFGRIDPEAVFFTGHSRGGGATQASHVRSIPLRARGVIYCFAYDLRYQASVVPPVSAPEYAIPTRENRLPSLIFSAENDGDLYYPWADEFIDRATGPTTFVTISGADHDQLGDNHTPLDGSPSISESDEQGRIVSFIVAFVRRWAKDDVSLEGFLYGSEHATSPYVSVASWRRSSPLLMVDDFQGPDPATNALGGANLVTGMTRTDECTYPPAGNFASLGIVHANLALDQNPPAAYGAPAPPPITSSFELGLGPKGATRDLSSFGTILMRIEQPGYGGYTIDMWVGLHDAHGTEASVKVANQDGSSTGYLPGLAAPGQRSPVFDRFVTLFVPLTSVLAANPSLDLAHVDRLDITFLQSQSGVYGALGSFGPKSIVIDDVRFEGGPLAVAAPPAPALPAIVLAADGAPAVAAESIVSAYGTDLALQTVAAAAPSASVGGTTITVTDAQGVARPALIFFASPGQVNFEIPSGTNTGNATISLEAGGSIWSSKVSVGVVAPGLFSANGTGQGVAAAGITRVKSDGTQTNEPVAQLDASGKAWVPLPVDLGVASGDRVFLILYGTGIRGGASSTAVTLNGVPATVTYSGPQGELGLDQVNVLVPPSLAGQGLVNVALSAGGVSANVVQLAVQ